MWGCGDSHEADKRRAVVGPDSLKISLRFFQEPRFGSEMLPIFLLLVHCSLVSHLKEHTSRGIKSYKLLNCYHFIGTRVFSLKFFMLT